MTQLFANSEQVLSCDESRNDDLFRDSAGCGGGVTAATGQVIAVGIGGFFDELEIAQAFQITSQAGDRQIGQEGIRFTISSRFVLGAELFGCLFSASIGFWFDFAVTETDDISCDSIGYEHVGYAGILRRQAPLQSPALYREDVPEASCSASYAQAGLPRREKWSGG